MAIRRLAAALAVALVAAAPAPAGASTAQAGGEISAVQLTDRQGQPLLSAMDLNEAGQVLARPRSNPLNATNAVWDGGRLSYLPHPGRAVLTALHLSDAGQVVGHYASSLPPERTTPFSWARGRFTTLPTQGRYGTAMSANDRGQVVGLTWGDSHRDPRVVVWQGGTLTAAPPEVTMVPSSRISFGARQINDAGQVPVDLQVGERRHAAVWQVGGGVTDLGAPDGGWATARIVSRTGHVAGYGVLDGSDQRRAYLWRDGETIDLGPIGNGGDVTAINDRGDVIGYRQDWPESSRTTFLWRDGERIDLGSLGGIGTWATAINNHGQVVGFSAVAVENGQQNRAFVWEDGRMTDLSAAVGGVPSSAFDINDRGQIVGNARLAEGDPLGPTTVVMWTVPPGT